MWIIVKNIELIFEATVWIFESKQKKKKCKWNQIRVL